MLTVALYTIYGVSLFGSLILIAIDAFVFDLGHNLTNREKMFLFGETLVPFLNTLLFITLIVVVGGQIMDELRNEPGH